MEGHTKTNSLDRQVYVGFSLAILHAHSLQKVSQRSHELFNIPESFYYLIQTQTHPMNFFSF
jgi:hypothetical protein